MYITKQLKMLDYGCFTNASAPVGLDDNQHRDVPPEGVPMIPHLAYHRPHALLLVERLDFATKSKKSSLIRPKQRKNHRKKENSWEITRKVRLGHR